MTTFFSTDLQQPYGIAILNGNMYIGNNGETGNSISEVNIANPTIYDSNFSLVPTADLNPLTMCSDNQNFLYSVDSYNNILRINTSTHESYYIVSDAQGIFNIYSVPISLYVDNNYLYAVTNVIYKFDINVWAPLEGAAPPPPYELYNPTGYSFSSLVIFNNTIYFTYVYNDIHGIGKMNTDFTNVDFNWYTQVNYEFNYLTLYNNYIYSLTTTLSNNVQTTFGPTLISRINPSNVNDISLNFITLPITPDIDFESGLDGAYAGNIIGYNNKLYLTGSNYLYAGYTQNVIYSYDLPIPPLVCFKEDTFILTNNGYTPIQNLRKGALVKTKNHDFVPINMIGRKEIYHIGCNERIKDQLYKCSKEQFPEIFEDLIITGCHCILVDDYINEKQKEKVIEINKGRIFITDNKYRLPACIDERTTVYEKKGNHIIYHLALENDDYYMNYGIYANGLLVESCSKRYLKELSNMELIEHI